MKKIFITAAVVLATFTMSAKVFENVGPVQQVQGITVDAPVISADGSFVVSASTNGLDKIDLASGKAETIVKGSGFSRVALSPDGNTVVYAKTTYDKNHLSYKSLEATDIATGKTQTLVKASRDLAAGVALGNTEVKAVNDGRMAKKSINKGAQASAQLPVVAINKGHLTVDGKTIDPQGKGSYLWPQLSPDGKKIVYWLTYRGCFTCNIDGTDVRPVGGIRAAVWAGNDAVVGMVEQDANAQVLTASKLVAIDLNSGEEQTLTPESVIAMYPSVDTNANRVAFTDPEGNLYFINIAK